MLITRYARIGIMKSPDIAEPTAADRRLNRVSPYYLYSEASSVLMNPAARAINAVSYAQLAGALSSYLSLGQSLLLVWPHLVGLLALTFAAFTISYVGFMRQEIRGN